MPAEDTSTPTPKLQSMDRWLRILELLTEKPMRTKELADETGYKWTTTQRALANLREHDFVRRDEDSGLHYIGRRMFSIGASYLQDHPLLNTSRSAMRALSDQTGGFVQIAERDGNYSTAIASVEPRSAADAITAFSMLGRRYPLHTGARGIVLLTYADPAFVDEYLSTPLASLTPYSITDPGELRAKLEQTRDQGYSVCERDVTLWSASTAAPIRNHAGEVVASAAIVTYVEDQEHSTTAPRVAVDFARSLSHSLGWRLV